MGKREKGENALKLIKTILLQLIAHFLSLISFGIFFLNYFYYAFFHGWKGTDKDNLINAVIAGLITIISLILYAVGEKIKRKH